MLTDILAPIHHNAKFKHVINGVSTEDGKEFTITQHNNNPLTITKSVIMYFTKHNYILIGSKRIAL